MPQLSRKGSLEDDLLKEFDRLIAKRGYANCSEAFRDLIREALLSEMVDSNKPVVGTLTIVYDHHVPNLSQKLTEVRHHAGAMILAAPCHGPVSLRKARPRQSEYNTNTQSESVKINRPPPALQSYTSAR